MSHISRLFAASRALIRDHQRPYLVLNLVYYGLVLAGMGLAAVAPGLQDQMLQSANRDLTDGPLAVVGAAYGSGRVLPAFGITFVINLLVGSLVFLTLPSLVVPFLGIGLGAGRALAWGLLFYPGHSQIGWLMIPHSLTLVVEGQAYILAMLGVWLQGRALVFPSIAGGCGRWAGFRQGLQQTALVYPLIIGLLLVAALYEAIEVIGVARAVAGPG